MLTYTTSDTENDLQGILELQKANLTRNLSKEEIDAQGFVTVDHSYEQLKKLNDLEKHVIVKDNDKIVGYLLAMVKECKQDIPVLIPMFKEFDNVVYKNKRISAYNYIVVGQVCIEKKYRGSGMLDECYNYYKEHFSSQYDFAITEIASTNSRSLNAHYRIGFKTIHTYPAPNNAEWHVVLWDWRT